MEKLVDLYKRMFARYGYTKEEAAAVCDEQKNMDYHGEAAQAAFDDQYA